MIKNLLKTDPFTSASLTREIELRPAELYRGKIFSGAFGVRFAPESIATTVVGIVKDEIEISLVTNVERGAPADYSGVLKKGVLSYHALAHYPRADYIRPADVQDIALLADTYRLKSVTDVVRKKMQRLMWAHDFTKDYAMATALQGKLMGSDGKMLKNWYTEFDFTKKTVALETNTSSTIMRAKCDEILQHMEDNAKGQNISGATALLGRTLWEAFTNHANVYDIFKQQSGAGTILADSLLMSGFRFGGITFYPWFESYTDVRGVTRVPMDAEKGIVIPTGTTGMLRIIYGPADRLSEEANQPGKALWVKRYDDPHDKFILLDSEANFLCVNTRPDLVVHLSL